MSPRWEPPTQKNFLFQREGPGWRDWLFVMVVCLVAWVIWKGLEGFIPALR